MIDANRREFLTVTGAAFSALVASGCSVRPLDLTGSTEASPYGPLRTDPAGFLDLPAGFTYRVISRLGDVMDDGGTVPDRADGMGCFDIGNGKLALVRNHELRPQHEVGGDPDAGYDRNVLGQVLPGGTTTLILDADDMAIERQFRSLAGTIRNCAGGITPWGSWLSCEEDVTKAGDGVRRDHGWVFEIPATATGLVEPLPLMAMGRFNHEAACVDPASGIVYMTEDRDDSLFYRFLPNMPGKLSDGGRLQALAVHDLLDVRNHNGAAISVGEWAGAKWLDLENVESPGDDLRRQGAAKGATMFARGEGLHMGDGELYFCCTSGGAAGLGQIFRLVPRAGAADQLQLYFESTSVDQFNYGDNLTVSPNGHLIVCEDQYTDVVDNHLRGIDRSGRAYPLARLRTQTELAGACWSPDGRTLFVNAYSPTATLAISGPWVS